MPNRGGRYPPHATCAPPARAPRVRSIPGGYQPVSLIQAYFLDFLHVVVANVIHGIREQTALEGTYQIAYGVFDRPLRSKADFATDLLRRDVVGARIIGRR